MIRVIQNSFVYTTIQVIIFAILIYFEPYFEQSGLNTLLKIFLSALYILLIFRLKFLKYSMYFITFVGLCCLISIFPDLFLITLFQVMPTDFINWTGVIFIDAIISFLLFIFLLISFSFKKISSTSNS